MNEDIRKRAALSIYLTKLGLYLSDQNTDLSLEELIDMVDGVRKGLAYLKSCTLPDDEGFIE